MPLNEETKLKQLSSSGQKEKKNMSFKFQGSKSFYSNTVADWKCMWRNG